MAAILFVNTKIASIPEVEIVERDAINQSTLRQLNALKTALNKNADLSMQSLYPEGYVFLNAVYALAWSESLKGVEAEPYKQEGQREIEQAWLKINSETGKMPFNSELPLSYGAFYNGWSSFVLGKKLLVEEVQDRSEEQVGILKDQCRRMALVLERDTYPVSYVGGAWPADVMMCVASLSLHDKLFEPLYSEAIRNWMARVKQNLDPLGMIPHSVHPGSGKTVENARGSSMALMLLFLHEIDKPFAEEQFKLFKNHFIDTTLGLTGVREYPKGVNGEGDVDSGPLIFGYGGASTIVGTATSALYGEHELSCRIRGVIEALAFGYENKNQKQYFFGYLPMADAFIVWGDAGVDRRCGEVSFIAFRIYSGIVFMIVAVLFWGLWRWKKRTDKGASYV